MGTIWQNCLDLLSWQEDISVCLKLLKFSFAMFTPILSFVQLTQLTFFNQSCCQSEMVARTVSVLHQEEHRGSCCPHPSPPPWDPSEDLRCITTTFQYLQTSGTAFFFFTYFIFIPLKLQHVTDQRHQTLPSRRLVLGFHLCEWSSGSSAKTAWRHVSHAGQQSSPAHAGTVGKDPLWTH